MLILYRPFLFDKPEMNPPVDSADEWTSTVVRRTREAATNTNKILGNMIGADMISSTQAMVYVHLQRTKLFTGEDAKYRQLHCLGSRIANPSP
jgi:hypothetical protein